MKQGFVKKSFTLCSDGASVMFGDASGFDTLVVEGVPEFFLFTVLYTGMFQQYKCFQQHRKSTVRIAIRSYQNQSSVALNLKKILSWNGVIIRRACPSCRICLAFWNLFFFNKTVTFGTLQNKYFYLDLAYLADIFNHRNEKKSFSWKPCSHHYGHYWKLFFF